MYFCLHHFGGEMLLLPFDSSVVCLHLVFFVVPSPNEWCVFACLRVCVCFRHSTPLNVCPLRGYYRTVNSKATDKRKERARVCA